MYVYTNTYSLVLLIKVVDISVQDLDEQLDRHGGVHARISHSQGPLQALQNPFAVAVELLVLVSAI